jgi:hypothetical protein
MNSTPLRTTRACLLGVLLLAAALAAPARAARPDPPGWCAGDMHVHRSCGGTPVSVSSIYAAMVATDLDVVSLLADMGNGEVQNPSTDLPLVTGADDPVSTAGRIVHWDAEWHWDATYYQYAHQALGGHLIALGIDDAYPMWEEYTQPVLDWARQHGGITGFAHFQYLDQGIPRTLTCCTPVEYPVEVALGAADFISEDVAGGDAVIHAYYRLLNCGFRPGLAAGSDYPCDGQIGGLLTYGKLSGAMTYRRWLDAIDQGRTVVSRRGRRQFLDLRVNGTAGPGDQVQLAAAGAVPVSVRWTANETWEGTLEIVRNGVVVASQPANVANGVADSLTASIPFNRSGWLCARVMDAGGHQVHTAAVFVIVNGAPVRASADDAKFYVRWIDTLIERTSPGGEWASYFPTERAVAQARYQAARAVFQQIADEATSGRARNIFHPADTPDSPAAHDGQAIELGVRFRSTVDGFVTGVRFYKGVWNSGPHVGHLWTNGGAVLAQGTLAAESDVGWQQIEFAAPVPIAAGVTYVAGYHSDGYYADTPQGLASAVVNGPLRALADGEDGANGLYSYSATPTFPTSSYESTSYSVDVAFVPADTLPPSVAAVIPEPDQTGVPVGALIRAWLTEAADAATVSATSFELRGPGNTLIPATVAWDAAGSFATLTPQAPLQPFTAYQVTLHGGTNGPRLADPSGNTLASDQSWSFVTASGGVAGVDPSALTVPSLEVHPNPSRGRLWLALQTPGSEGSLEVVDVSGRVVRRLKSPDAGASIVAWDGRDDDGQRVGAGLYFARLRSAGCSVVARFAIIP